MNDSFKLCSVIKEQSMTEGVIPFILSKKIVDRDSEVILPDGIVLDNFLKNPVFLWAHDLKFPPPGKLLPETMQQDEIILQGDVLFDLEDSFAKMIYMKYKNGFLNAGSIRFMPLEVGKPILQGQRGHTYTKSELLEFSAVPVPSNPEALKKELDKYVQENGKTYVHYFDVLKNFYDVFEKDKKADMPPQVGWLAWVKDIKSGDGFNPGEPSEPVDIEKPYPEEYACRLRDPKDFEPDSFRRTTREHDGKEYSVIMGKLKGEDTMTEQAYRYNKNVWTEDEASKHCEDHSGTFEAAKKEIDGVGLKDVAWIKRLKIKNNAGEQEVYSIFHGYEKEIDEDAEIIECNGDDINFLPHPYAGKTIPVKEVIFVPAIKQYDVRSSLPDEIHFVSKWDTDRASDEEFLKSFGELFEVVELSSEAIDTLEISKSVQGDETVIGFPFKVITSSGINRMRDAIKQLNLDVVQREYLAKYDLTRWSEVARCMNDLIANEELSDKDKRVLYKVLLPLYGKFDKKAPELLNSQKLSESLEDQQSDAALLEVLLADDSARDLLIKSIVEHLHEVNNDG